MKTVYPTDEALFRSGTDDSAAMRPLKLNPDKYRDQLADWQLTPEQEVELLQILWDIMSTFVRMGMGQDATQLILSSLIEKTVVESNDVLDRKGSELDFNELAANEDEKEMT